MFSTVFWLANLSVTGSAPACSSGLCLGNQELQPLRQCTHTTPAIAGARPVLHQTAGLAAYDFPVHLK